MTINNDAELFEFRNWNENNVNTLASNNWRASLVPAAAVIPAPIAYIKVVAVKKLVVGFQGLECGPPKGEHRILWDHLPEDPCALYWVCVGVGDFTLKKLECSKQAFA